jgi:Zn-finger nucleic acid-binding protein
MSNIQYPRFQGSWEQVVYSNTLYEKCPMCYGVWFDAGEFKDYKE